MIKATAIRDMQGNWWRALLLSFIESAIVVWIVSFLPLRIPSEQEMLAVNGDTVKLLQSMLPKEITPKVLMSVGVTVLLYLFAMAPFGIGKCKYFLKAARGEKATLLDVFSVYANLKTVFSSILLSVITTIFTTLSFVVCMIIPVGMRFAALWQESILLYEASTILSMAFAVVFIVWISRYRFISYIYANDEKGAFSAIYKYMKYMKKRNGECLALGASYLIWYFLMWLMPFLSFVYLCLSSTVYAKYTYRFRGELSFGELENLPPEM